MASSAYDTLAAVFDAVITDPSEAGFAAAMLQHPDAPDALCAYLRERYVDGTAEAGSLEDLELFWSLLAMVLSHGSDRARARFVTEVALQVRHPEVLRNLAPLLQDAVQPRDLEDAIVDAMRDGDERARRNAFELEYYAFQFGGEGYQMSAPAKKEFAHLAARHAMS